MLVEIAILFRHKVDSALEHCSLCWGNRTFYDYLTRGSGLSADDFKECLNLDGLSDDLDECDSLAEGLDECDASADDLMGATG